MVTVNFQSTPGVQTPTKATMGSSGFDIYSPCEFMMQPNSFYILDTKLVLAYIPPNYEIQIRSRSSLASLGLLIMNGIGTIDSDYRGSIKIPFRNIGTNTLVFKEGDRIAQMVVTQLPLANVKMVTDTGYTYNTDRADGGFGSTGT